MTEQNPNNPNTPDPNKEIPKQPGEHDPNFPKHKEQPPTAGDGCS